MRRKVIYTFQILILAILGFFLIEFILTLTSLNEKHSNEYIVGFEKGLIDDHYYNDDYFFSEYDDFLLGGDVRLYVIGLDENKNKINEIIKFNNIENNKSKSILNSSMTFGLITIDYKSIVNYKADKINIYTNEEKIEDKKYGDTLRVFKMKTNNLAVSLNNKLEKDIYFETQNDEKLPLQMCLYKKKNKLYLMFLTSKNIEKHKIEDYLKNVR